MRKFSLAILMAIALPSVALETLPEIPGFPPVSIPYLTYNSFGVQVHGDPATSYAVEYSVSLQGGPWTTVAFLKGDGRITVPFNKNGGFYRARTSPPIYAPHPGKDI